MLKLINRNEINTEAYDKLVRNCTNTRVYAESWYLDTILGSSWGAIVCDNYEKVMPLPYSRNYRFFFRKRVMQPMFCQQLGIFGLAEIDKNTILESFSELFNSTKPFTYHFNSSVKPFLETNKIPFKERKNYILNLNNSYEQIKKGYSNNLNRNLKKAKAEELQYYTATDQESWFTFLEIKINQLRLHRKKRWTQRIGRIMKAALNKEQGYFAIVSKNNQPLAMAFILESPSRLIYLFAVRTTEGAKCGANHFLIDSLIRKEAESKRILDFEGSDIEGVERFFKSFGAINEPYYCFGP